MTEKSKAVLCRYDCNLHAFQYHPPTEHYELCRKLDLPKLPYDPCCEDCFLHVTDLRDHISRVYSRKKNRSKPSQLAESEAFLKNFKTEKLNTNPWDERDKIILNRLRRIYRVSLSNTGFLNMSG